MSKAQLTAVAAISLIGALTTSQARAQSAGADAEIAALKQQLRLMEQKLDKLQKQTAANTAATAKRQGEGRRQGGQRRQRQRGLSGQGPSCSVGRGCDDAEQPADHLHRRRRNCIAITSRMHFDGGGYDYHPNTPATVPQRLDNGVNLRRARIGVLGKFMDDWNFAPDLRLRRFFGRLCQHRKLWR